MPAPQLARTLPAASPAFLLHVCLCPEEAAEEEREEEEGKGRVPGFGDPERDRTCPPAWRLSCWLSSHLPPSEGQARLLRMGYRHGLHSGVLQALSPAELLPSTEVGWSVGGPAD